MSLLGVAVGATASLVLDRSARAPSWRALATAGAASCLATIVVETRLDPLVVGLPVVVVVAYVFGSAPSLFASWIIVRSLRARPENSGRLYAADLAGAACGSAAAFVGITPLGVPALYAVAALLGSVATATARPRSLTHLVVPAFAFAGVLALSAWGDVLTPALVGPGKDEALRDPGVTREAVRWDPLARVDVLGGRSVGPPSHAPAFFIDRAYTGAYPTALSMLLDLGVSTPILGGDLTSLQASLLAAPYAILESPSVLVIGPGGGIDVDVALVHRARRVDAVEVNRSVAALMRGPFAAYSGDVYGRPGVRVYEDEARSFVRRSHDRYDLIVMTVVDSYAALASGSYALTESYLYTEEAFRDHLRHLTDDGVLAVGRWYRDPPTEMLRLARVAAGGLRAEGIADVERHLLVLRYESFGLLLVDRRGFDAERVDAIGAFAGAHQFRVVFDPLHPTEPFMSVIADQGAPTVTDDRPFFFADEPTRQTGGGLPVAYGILYLALLSSAALSYAFVLLPQRVLSRGVLGLPEGPTITFCSAAVGFGFIALEIVLLQRLTLYLGQPALALSLGLAAMLLGAALGSAASARLRGVSRSAAVSAIVLAAFLVAMQALTEATVDQELIVRLAVATLGVGAAAIPLGAVFPQVIRRAADADPRLVYWAWAVNGVASVVGSIVAVALAIAAGFTVVGTVAVLCYALVALLALRGRGA